MTSPTKQLPDLTDEQISALWQEHQHIRSFSRALLALGQQTARDVQAEAVYLVATGETYEGQETYTRHDAPVPMADSEKLYAAPQASDVQPVGAVADDPQWHLMHDAIMTAVSLMQGDPTIPVYAKDWFAAHTVLRQALIAVAELAAAPALQGESGATVAEGIEAAAKLADWSAPHVARNIRALAPQPTTGATVADQRDAARWQQFMATPGEWSDVSSSEIAEHVESALAQDAAGEQS